MFHLALWLLGMALGITAFLLMATSVTAHWSEIACCRHCGYDLRAHREGCTCPECGQPTALFPDGYIERNPRRFVTGVIVLLAAFAVLGVALVRTLRQF
jgi:hypothetical protein